MAKKSASIRFDEEKLELAKKETGQKSIQSLLNFFLDEIWRKHHPPKALDIISTKIIKEEGNETFAEIKATICDVAPSGLKFKNKQKSIGFPFAEKYPIESTKNDKEKPLDHEFEFMKKIVNCETIVDAEKLGKEINKCFFLTNPTKASLLKSLKEQTSDFYND